VGYGYPFRREQRGHFDEWSQPSDIVAVTDRAYVRIAPKWWPGNQGSVLVIIREHVENLYALSPENNHAVWDLVQRLAIAVRSTYRCEGVSVRQHNEPAGDQDVWHLHFHVFPRHQGDELYLRHADARWVDAADRAGFAARLRPLLGMPTIFQMKHSP
jgi:histidine triad (HIT) family protein